MNEIQHRRQAMAARPQGHGIVGGGDLLPDDLVWDWVGKSYIRADSDEWTCKPVDVETSVLVIRKAAYRAAPEQPRRSYSVHREAPTSLPISSSSTPGQDNLF